VISRFFIDRPIFASVFSIIIFVVGLASMTLLPVERFPTIAPPTVMVTASYPGANAETAAESIAAPIEQRLSGIKNLLYFQSFSANDGSVNITATFDTGTDVDLAAVEVQNRVKLAEPFLPQETIRQGIKVEKSSTAILNVISLESTNPEHDTVFLSNYAQINMIDSIRRVPGIGDAYVFGGQEYSMRIWLNPDDLAAKGLTVADVAAAVREQNGLYAAGRLGAEPTPGDVSLTIPVVAEGRLRTVEQFENVVVRADAAGNSVRVRDVARVELSSLSFDLVGRQDGRPTTFILTFLQSGANALQATSEMNATLERLKANYPPGVRHVIPFDTTPFIQIAINEVAKTFAEALFLVSAVVLLFLGTWRATLIPLMAVPVAIIGTFTGMWLLGFSVNSLTLFGLVLAIGIVVDDAIIVVENVERVMETEGLPVREATIRAMEQVTGPIIAIVFVLSSVFLPVGFLGGLTGEMYKQFAVTIAVSVMISGLVALTLSPAMCVVLLKETHGRKLLPFRLFDRLLGRFTSGYARFIRQTIRYGVLTFAIFLAMLYATWDLFRHRVPGGFIPQEDQGFFIVAVFLPPAASIDRTEEVIGSIEATLMKDPDIRHVVALSGIDFFSGMTAATNSGILFVSLKPWDERRRPDQHVDAVTMRANMAFMNDPRAMAFAINPPAVDGLGLRAGFEYQLQNRSGATPEELAATLMAFTAEAAKRPELANVNGQFNVATPKLQLKVDVERAKALGISISDIYESLQALLGSLYVNDFVKFGRIYRVQVQAEPQYRLSPGDIDRFFVRNASGQMVPLNGVVSSSFVAGPNVIARFNSFPSVQITGEPAPGYSTGEAIAAMDDLSRKALPSGYDYEWSGASFQEIRAGNQAPYVIGFGLFIVFLVLAAQYERWSLPFAVLLGIPSGAFGALLALWLRSKGREMGWEYGPPLTKDLYFQVGLLTLIGLAAKNAILIVEFSASLREQGKGIVESAVEAARVRLRPFMMTSLAFILGVLPLAISSGAGAAGRHSIGTCVMGGMIAATFLDMFFVPLFFVMMQWLGEKFSRPTAIPA
jgi:hydrophobe/amphiphile efflux-1 (HAE1) family protein